ncbi:hypothetical protein DFJ73DRAFT_802171 [Zopfochytrium polystomum]|nr:hypothetical protein DFJ73DRAFT_802171 [Zopfochytrium polystomum]
MDDDDHDHDDDDAITSRRSGARTRPATPGSGTAPSPSTADPPVTTSTPSRVPFARHVSASSSSSSMSSWAQAASTLPFTNLADLPLSRLQVLPEIEVDETRRTVIHRLIIVKERQNRKESRTRTRKQLLELLKDPEMPPTAKADLYEKYKIFFLLMDVEAPNESAHIPLSAEFYQVRYSVRPAPGFVRPFLVPFLLVVMGIVHAILICIFITSGNGRLWILTAASPKLIAEVVHDADNVDFVRMDNASEFGD